jgi:hypothetical protein
MATNNRHLQVNRQLKAWRFIKQIDREVRDAFIERGYSPRAADDEVRTLLEAADSEWWEELTERMGERETPSVDCKDIIIRHYRRETAAA